MLSLLLSSVILLNCDIKHSHKWQSKKALLGCVCEEKNDPWLIHGGEVSAALFQKLEKSAPILGKNAEIVTTYGLYLSCSFKSFQEKKANILSCGAFLSCVVDKMFIEVPKFQGNSPNLKNSCLRAWITIYLYFKKAYSWIWGNLWQLKCFLFHIKSSFYS